MKRRGRALIVVGACALGGCDRLATSADPGGAPEAGASPNASILPAPLATEVPEVFDGGVEAGAVVGIPVDSAGRLVFPDAGPPPPSAVRPDLAVPPEVPSLRELVGLSLAGEWRWRDVPAPPKGGEVWAIGIKAARELTRLAWKIDLSEAGRMRIEFASRALPMPMRSEIRARSDRYGHLVLWPGGTEYRVVAPGALRPLLGERRVDVTPVSVATPMPAGEGSRLGLAVRRLDLASSLGTLRLEIAKVPEAGEGGELLCRTLIEVIGVDPKTPACQAGEVPLAASYAWRAGGGIAFEITTLTKRIDLPSNELLVPPPGAAFVPAGLPAVPDGIFLSRDELAAFRAAPVAIAPSQDPRVPGEGFVAANRSDALMYLLVDGVPVVAVPPEGERYLIGTARGRYVTQWRTFLGDRTGPVQTVELPARLTYGEVPDAGAGDGG